jgi:hypothetical protein
MATALAARKAWGEPIVVVVEKLRFGPFAKSTWMYVEKALWSVLEKRCRWQLTWSGGAEGENGDGVRSS